MPRIRTPDLRPLPARGNVFCADFAVAGGRYKRVTYAATDRAVAVDRHRWLVNAWLGLNRQALPPSYPWTNAAAPAAPAARLHVSFAAVAAAFIRHRRRKDRTGPGRFTESDDARLACRRFRDRYRDLDARAINAGHVEAFQSDLADGLIPPRERRRDGTPYPPSGPLAVSTVAKQTRQVLAAFRRAAKVKIVPASVAHDVSLADVARPGDRNCKPAVERPQIDDADLARVLPLLPPVPAAVLRIMRESGARPSELFAATPADLDTSRPDEWRISLTTHKTSAKTKTARLIILNARSIEALRPFVTLDMARPIFRSEAKRQRQRERDRWQTHEFCKVVRRACVAAGVTGLTSYMARHRLLSEVRAVAGLEAAQAVAGHTTPVTTTRYARVPAALASSAIAGARPAAIAG